MTWKERCKLIPDGCSTMSKMPCRRVEGVYPETIEAARGAYIYHRPDGVGLEKGWVDYELGLGAVVLGHANPHVNQAVMTRIENGNTISAASRMEGELAEKLIDLIPSAEMVRFTVTGSEACHAAIKLARAYTGNERIIHAGYHGWLSWYSAQSPHNKGCTEAEKGQIATFQYNDFGSFTRLFRGARPPAAVIMEPYVFEAPEDGFLTRIKNYCHKKGTLLIFDEVVTAFRTEGWTAQKMLGVTPDLTCVGKCMANGLYPISAVCGRKDIMQELTKGCFVSGTFAANPLALASALETVKMIETFGAITNIWEYGRQFKAAFEQRVAARDAKDVSIGGYPCRTYFTFPTEAHKSLFWQECFKHGIWFGYAQFISYAHTGQELDKTIYAMEKALDKVLAHWDKPEEALEGKVAQATFRMVERKEKD